MGGPAGQYTKELFKATQYWATWLPGTPLRLGDVGTIEDQIFVPRSTLDSFGVDFEEIMDTNPMTIDYTSRGSVSVDFKAKGQTNSAFKFLGKADAGAAVTFSRENATLFSASDCYQHRIKDQVKVQDKILAMREENPEVWPDNYAAITDLVVAGSATILISSARDAHVEIKAKADIGSVVDLGKAEAGLKIASSKEMFTQIVAASGLTPLFRVIRIKRDWWTGEDVVVPFGTPEFEKVDYDQEEASSGEEA